MSRLGEMRQYDTLMSGLEAFSIREWGPKEPSIAALVRCSLDQCPQCPCLWDWTLPPLISWYFAEQGLSALCKSYNIAVPHTYTIQHTPCSSAEQTAPSKSNELWQAHWRFETIWSITRWQSRWAGCVLNCKHRQESTFFWFTMYAYFKIR